MKSFRKTLAVIIVLVLSLLCLPAYILAANNTLEVQCVDKSGNPVAGVKVEIMNLENQKWKDKKSDPKGIARFDKSDDGVYRIRSRKEGFAPALYEFVALKGDKQESVKLVFEPGADHPLYFEEQGKSAGPQAMEALKGGVEDLRAGKYDDAINKLKTSLTLNPSNPEAHFNLAIAYIQQKKWDEGEVELKAVSRITGALMQMKIPEGQPNVYAQINQNSEGILQKLQGFKLRSEGSDFLQKKSFKEAAQKFQESLKYIADDPDTYYNMALAQAQAKMFPEAQQSIQKAISMKPAEKAYTDLKQQIDGLKEQDTVQKAQVIVDAGEALFKSNDFAGAMQKYQEAKGMLPPKGQAVVMTLIGKAEAAQNHQDAALQAYKQAIELDPENPRFKNALALYHISQKKYDDALGLLCTDGDYFACGQKLAKDPNGAQVAQLAFDRSIQKNPANAEAYYELGMMLYFSKENDKKARELLAKYVEIGKDSGHLDNAKSSIVILDRRIK